MLAAGQCDVVAVVVLHHIDVVVVCHAAALLRYRPLLDDLKNVLFRGCSVWRVHMMTIRS